MQPKQLIELGTCLVCISLLVYIATEKEKNKTKQFLHRFLHYLNYQDVLTAFQIQ